MAMDDLEYLGLQVDLDNDAAQAQQQRMNGHDKKPYADLEHRHFRTIAAIIAKLPDRDTCKAEVAGIFAGELAKTNPRFNAARFMAACLHE